MTIRDVERAATRSRDATERLRQAVAAAHGEGVPVATLATAADVTRQTIYRWIGGK